MLHYTQLTLDTLDLAEYRPRELSDSWWMYSSCLVCHGPLGQNTLLEHTSVGRAIAFDSRQGRLWIVCRRCYAWNLTPLEERWESIEECEKRFEVARRRYSTENVGLAEFEDVRLIRIGGPPHREFAAWRYGRRLTSRRYRAAFHVVAGGVTVGSTLALVRACSSD